MPDLIPIRTFVNRSEADFVKELLESYGIKAAIGDGELCRPLTIGAELFVLEEDVSEAMEILDSHQSHEDSVARTENS